MTLKSPSGNVSSLRARGIFWARIGRLERGSAPKGAHAKITSQVRTSPATTYSAGALHRARGDVTGEEPNGSDSVRAGVVTRTGLNLVRLSATLAWGIIPSLCETVLHAFGDDEAVPRWPSVPCGPVLDSGAGTRVLWLGPVVAKITGEKADHLAARFGG